MFYCIFHSFSMHTYIFREIKGISIVDFLNPVFPLLELYHNGLIVYLLK